MSWFILLVMCSICCLCLNCWVILVVVGCMCMNLCCVLMVVISGWI